MRPILSSQEIGISEQVLDDDWIALIKEAKEMGMTVEQVMSFLNPDKSS